MHQHRDQGRLDWGDTSITGREIHVPDGFRASNKYRWPLIAAARADVGEGTAVGSGWLGNSCCVVAVRE
jgi:hypothetical protein